MSPLTISTSEEARTMESSLSKFIPLSFWYDAPPTL